MVISGDDVSIGSTAVSDEAVSTTPSGKSSPTKSLLWHGFLKPTSSLLFEEEAVLELGSVESSSTREVSSAWVSKKGKVAIRQLSPKKGMIQHGFLLR